MLKVLDTPEWPVRPLPDDHKDADKTVGTTVFKSLMSKYIEDNNWQDPKTAPIIMRTRQQRK